MLVLCINRNMTSVHNLFNAVDYTGQSFLHRAIVYSPPQIVHEILKYGCNINVQARDKRTPLHYAVEYNNLEAVSLLLFHGADVNIMCNRDFSPFTYALYLNRMEIAMMLFPYYDEFPYANVYGYTALHLAARRKSAIAIDLVKAGANVNCVTNYGESPLAFSLEYNDAELFKLIWCKCDCQTLLHSQKPFLLIYIQQCCFSASEWLECIYAVLESSAAFDLIQHCKLFVDEEVREFGFFWELLYAFYKMGIKHADRITVINICLGLGAEVNIHDINLALDLYGFDAEFEALMYVIDWQQALVTLNYHFKFPLPTLICAVEDLNMEALLQLFKKQMLYSYDLPERNEVPRDIVNALGFLSLPPLIKQEFLTCCTSYLDDYSQICKKLEAVPEIPSLIELCRDKARRYIKEVFKVKKPYQYHDAVKRLGLPQILVDILRFKAPLY